VRGKSLEKSFPKNLNPNKIPLINKTRRNLPIAYFLDCLKYLNFFDLAFGLVFVMELSKFGNGPKLQIGCFPNLGIVRVT
jgi:hypothetical protein